MNLKIASTITGIEDLDIQRGLLDFKSSMEELETIISKIDSTASNESLRDLFRGITSTYKASHSKLINLFKVSRIKYKTEFSEWIKKEHKLIEEVNKLANEKVVDLDIDYPTGMKIKYFDAMELLKEFYTNFDTGAKLSLVSSTVDVILNSISKDTNAHEESVKVADKSIFESSKNIVEAATVLKNNFDINKTVGTKKTFKELFSDIAELEHVCRLMGEIDEYVGNINRLNDQVKDIEKSLDLCVDYILEKSEDENSEYVPSKEFLKTFSNFIKQIDTLFSMYGDVTIRALAIQHNLIFVYNTLHKQI